MSNMHIALAADGFTLTEINGADTIDHPRFGLVYPVALLRDRYNFRSLKLRTSELLDNLKRGKEFHRAILQQDTITPLSCVCLTPEGWSKVQNIIIAAQLKAMGLVKPSRPSLSI